MFKYTFILVSILTSLFSYNQEDLEKYLATKSCEGCDLSFANLSDKDLQNSNLSGANLTGVNFQNSDLLKSNLWGTTLENANLDNTNLRASNLEASILINVQCDNTIFKGANLSNATLENLTCKKLSLWATKFLDTTFDNVDISNAGAAYSIFDSVDFTDLKIDGAIFWNAKIYNSTLSKSKCEYLEKEEAMLYETICE